MPRVSDAQEHLIAQIEASINGCTAAITELALIELRARQAMGRTDLADDVLAPIREHTALVKLALADAQAQLRLYLEATASDVAKHYQDQGRPDAVQPDRVGGDL